MRFGQLINGLLSLSLRIIKLGLGFSSPCRVRVIVDLLSIFLMVCSLLDLFAQIFDVFIKLLFFFRISFLIKDMHITKLAIVAASSHDSNLGVGDGTEARVLPRHNSFRNERLVDPIPGLHVEPLNRI